MHALTLPEFARPAFIPFDGLAMLAALKLSKFGVISNSPKSIASFENFLKL
jgi:hypothetical protein